MSECKLTGADMAHADLRGANLAGAINFHERHFSTIQWDSDTKLPIQVEELPGKPGTTEQRQLIRDLALHHGSDVEAIAKEFHLAIEQVDVELGTLRQGEDARPLARMMFRHGIEQGWLKPWIRTKE